MSKPSKEEDIVVIEGWRASSIVARGGGSGGEKIAKERGFRWSSDVDEWERPDFTSEEDCVALNRSERLSISVPATTANIGPGFDSLGFAVDKDHHQKAKLREVMAREVCFQLADQQAGASHQL